jgi:NADH:ubiquinone oxidoreductase subunit B-like Fe-S oxidoreductase
VVPVDVYVPGCPPTPESLYYGVLMLQNRVIKHATMAKRQGSGEAERWRISEQAAAREPIQHAHDASPPGARWGDPGRVTAHTTTRLVP